MTGSVYLITGGTGFIGAEVARQLAAAGDLVVAFSRSGNRERLKGMEGAVEIARGDVTDYSSLLETVKSHQVSHLIHLAFFTDILELDANPQKGIEPNCTGLMNVLEAARQGGVMKVVWTSSAAVYGEAERYERLPVDEDAPLFPLNVYGTYKVFCEQIGAHYHHRLGMANIALRPTIVFGAGRWFRGAAAYAHDLFHGPAQNLPVTVDCGDQLVDWLYVKDLARAIMLACRTETGSRIFNICGHRATVRKSADIIRAMEPSAVVEVSPGQRPMWVPRLSTARAENELGYRPLYSLDDSFRDCLMEIRGNRSDQEV